MTPLEGQSSSTTTIRQTTNWLVPGGGFGSVLCSGLPHWHIPHPLGLARGDCVFPFSTKSSTHHWQQKQRHKSYLISCSLEENSILPKAGTERQAGSVEEDKQKILFIYSLSTSGTPFGSTFTPNSCLHPGPCYMNMPQKQTSCITPNVCTQRERERECERLVQMRRQIAR